MRIEPVGLRSIYERFHGSPSSDNNQSNRSTLTTIAEPAFDEHRCIHEIGIGPHVSTSSQEVSPRVDLPLVGLWCHVGHLPLVRIWTVSQFELSGFAPLLNQIRVLEKFSPVPLEQFLTYDGVVGLTFDEPVLILCIVVWCIARGTDFVSGEVGRGTMEMLLAQPVSREKIALAHGSVTILGLLGLVAMTFLGLALGIHTCSSLSRSIRLAPFRSRDFLLR